MLHYDTGIINKFDTMPNGMIRLFGTIANTGWLEYYDMKGNTRNEYVGEECLFDEEGLASIAGCPLTLDHPPEDITPQNYMKYAVGSVSTQIIKKPDVGLVDIITVIGDEKAIRSIRDGKSDLSLGYKAAVVPFETEEKPNAYKQVKRIANHVSIVLEGRAEYARLHLDGWSDKPIKTPLKQGIRITKIKL